MKFAQSRLKTKIKFNFEADELEYSMQDNTSNLTFDVRYSNIPKRHQTFYERNEWLRNIGLLWLIIGIAFTIANFIQGEFRLQFWALIWLICLGAYRFTWSEYSYFDTEEGRILVLKDEQSTKILAEITSRRKAAFLGWFEKLEFDNSDQISQTLDYMVREKIFTRAEADIHLASQNDEPPKLLQ